MKPLVSVIITTYKTNGKLNRAIKSVLDQTYKNIEIIVVDDNDPNTIERKITEEIMKKFSSNSNIIYIKHEKNKNGAAARNTGINESNGEYIAFLDDDDFFLPSRVEICVGVLENNKKASGIYSAVLYKKYNSYYSCMIPKISGNIQKELLLNNNILGTGSNIFIKKECMVDLKGFDEAFIRFQDIEFMIRFFEFYNIIHVENVLVVKDTEGIGNIPNYLKMKNMVNLFFKKFKNIIQKYDAQSQIQMQNTYNTILYNVASSSKNKVYIKEATDKLRIIRNPSIKEKIKNFIFYFIPKEKIKRRDCLYKFKHLLNEQDSVYIEKLRKG